MAKAPVLTPQAEDFPRWYQDVVAKAELADNGPVRGTMVIRPYGYAIWERMQAEIDAAHQGGRRRRTATSRCSSRRATCAGRPSTSRASAPSWPWSPTPAARSSRSRSWSAPPARRSSASTSPSGCRATATCRCCSTSGPTWCAGSCGPACSCAPPSSSGRRATPRHATDEDAAAYAARILHEVYADFMVNVLAMPVLAGRKTAKERFAGAINTLTCEAMMGDGKALQMGTSHELGQNFAKAFDIAVPRRRRAAQEHVWTTSWGASHPHGRRPDHGPRRRQRPAAAAPARPDPGRRAARPGRGRRRRRGRAARRRAAAPPACGSGSTTAPTSASAAGPPTGSCKGVPGPGRGRARATWPRATSPWCAATRGAKAPVPLGRVAAARCRACSDDIQADLLAEATAAATRNTVDAAHGRRGRRGRRRRASPACRGRSLRPTTARPGLREAGVTVRCLRRPDGGAARTSEDEPDLVAIVARVRTDAASGLQAPAAGADAGPSARRAGAALSPRARLSDVLNCRRSRRRGRCPRLSFAIGGERGERARGSRPRPRRARRSPTSASSLYDLELVGGQLRVVVDRPGGVDLDAIAAATRLISRALDARRPDPRPLHARGLQPRPRAPPAHARPTSAAPSAPR